MTARRGRMRCVRRCGCRILGTVALGMSSVAASASAAAKRPIARYDGREKRTTPADVALWVPRIVLFPAYVVSEYVIRRPLGYAVTAAERAGLPSALYDFFVFGPAHKSGVVPVAFVDFGFNPSVGLYSFWDDAGFPGHDLRLNGSTWGQRWLSGILTERFRFSESGSLTLTGTLVRRPDYAFYGIGPNARESALSRYAADKAEARAIFRGYYWRASSAEATLGYRGMSLGAGHYDHDPSLEVASASGAFPQPAGYAAGYRALFSAVRLAVDTRHRKGGTEDGVRVEIETEQAANTTSDLPAGWLRLGGSVGGFVDLNGRSRVISLVLSALAVEALGSRAIPFTELVTLGGTEQLPGFRAGRLHGESAMTATLRYAWPIWMWLDGSMQMSFGNVYGAHWRELGWGTTRLSTAIGIESNGSRDSIFQLLVGFGTETFASGAALNSIRVVAGVRHGY
jgi:hypothetical protein